MKSRAAGLWLKDLSRNIPNHCLPIVPVLAFWICWGVILVRISLLPSMSSRIFLMGNYQSQEIPVINVVKNGSNPKERIGIKL